MVGCNCFIIFQYYYLNIKILKILNFLKFLKFFEIFEILKFFENSKLYILFFLIDFRILKFFEIFERVVSLLRHAMDCLPGNNRVVTR